MSEEQTGFSIEGSKPVLVLPADVELVLQRKDLFPNFPIQGWANGSKEFGEALGVTVAPENSDGANQLSFALREYGRSDFIPLIFESFDKTTFGCIYRRGVGGGNPREGDINYYPLISEGENAGLADINTTMAEASISELLHNEGFRVRMPIAVFRVRSVTTSEGTKTIEELVQLKVLSESYLKNKPVISLWAKRLLIHSAMPWQPRTPKSCFKVKGDFCG